MIIRLIRKAFPMLDYYLQLGAVLHQVGLLSTHRRDLQVVLYRGQIRIGYADERHDELDVRGGTIDVWPSADNWQTAALLAARLPLQELEYERS